MNKHWLTLYGDTFLWLKDGIGLIYNTKNKNRFIFSLSNRIIEICHQLLEIENLYSVELTDEVLNEHDVNEWIHSLIDIQAGYLSFNIEFKERPVSLKPILKVQDNKKYYEEQHQLGFKGKILQNLHEITFYINGSEYGSDEYFKQTIFPVKNNMTLDDLKIKSFIMNSRNPYLSNINLVGNIFLYLNLERLISSISNLSIQSTIHIQVSDFICNIQKVKDMKWFNNTRFNILVDRIFDVSCLLDISFPISITCFVFSENDFMKYSNIFDTFSANINVKYIPLFNKQNLIFFKDNIFIGKEDLSEINLSKNEIFMRQAFNIGDFGKLIVMPDGNVFANVNQPSLGTISNSPYSIIYNEFINGKSWFNLREQAPCNNCIYQWLCPSPSNYETVLGKPNLCHVQI